MKKIIILLFLVSIKSLAQPVLTSADFGSPVNYDTYFTDIPSNSNYYLNGPNLVWNFSNLNLGNPTFNTVSIPVSSCPGSENFPTSQYCEVRTDFNGSWYYDLFEITNSTYKKTAYTPSNNGVLYSSNQVVFSVLPYTYGQSEVLYVNNLGYSATKTYSSYGTLITPFETFTNVIKVTFSFPPDNGGPGSNHYAFFATNPYRKICNVVPSPMAPGYFEFFRYYDTLDLKTNNFDTFFSYPNPTKGEFFIKGISSPVYETYLTIYDFQGRVIAPLKKIESDLEKISLNNFNTGIYLIRITDKEGKLLYSEKIVKN